MDRIDLRDLIVWGYRGRAVPFDKEAVFQKQIEECRALERQALSTKDRVFWQQAAGRWEEQLRQAKAQTRKSPQQSVQTLSQDGAKA